ncbi:DUF4328 domain-containing protein [Pseudonocardia sp. DSM 110487]|uniref:DUF4328 domain-containing protein n=1 Tax=Pseudonocardia sp. DSM 110487 TaxID=2865833 RepID=UPI001C69B452|nr:DUF4328 domain-containing protein [Pseudonocardia sp. DSM 110487]QYN39647.1 DUF4328 domain-containing protein [Pseudonocardia sp. DSM 110487]
MTAVPPPVEPAPIVVPARPRPINGLGAATGALLVACALLFALFLIDDWSNYRLLSDHVSGRITDDAFWEQYSSGFGSLMLTLLMLPLIIASSVTWLVWVHRARTNAGILSPQYRFRYSPGFSVGGMVVPFANYWWFRPILEDICIGSSPHRPADDTVRLVRTCWGISIGATLVSIFTQPLFSFHVLTYTPDGRLVDGGADAVHGFFGVALYNTLLAVVFTPTVALLVMIIRRVSRQQTELLSPAQPA